jgi:hypothetical protein
MKRLVLIALALLCSLPIFANTPPTLSANLGLASGTGTSRATASLSWANGDLVVAGMVNEGYGTFTAPTATGLTFSNNPINHAPSSNCGLAIYTATAVGSGSSAITGHNSDGTHNWNIWVWVWHNHGGAGNNASQFTATKTVSLTPAGGADSAIIWVAGDWSAAASPAATPASPNETTRQAAVQGGAYSYVTADITNQTSAGAVSYGVNYTSSGPFSIGVLEIKGTAGGGSGVRKRVVVTRE